MTITRPKKIVLLGMMSRLPVAGVFWQTLHYLIGLRRLGYDVYYVEAHASTPSMLIDGADRTGSTRAARLIADVCERFDFQGRWAFHALHADGQCFGMELAQLRELYRNADLLINLHGGTLPLEEHAAAGRLIYVETDPVLAQIELHENVRETVKFLAAHRACFTFGENLNRPSCKLPVDTRFRFRPTRQPVVLDLWERSRAGPATTYTTIGNWRQTYRDVTLNGETYGWSKHAEFMKFLDLPKRTGARFELALGTYDDNDRALLEGRGFAVRYAPDFTRDLDAYRAYVATSRGEFTVAKDQNVRLRTGWFSDRSATYLACGRPVVTQDTGFGDILPTGAGLFSFATLDDASNAIEMIESDYERQSAAALDVARRCFAHDVVLPKLLAEVGV